MKLVERHIVRKGNNIFPVLIDYCIKATNLYNRAMFVVRQHYFRLTNKKYTEDISDSNKLYLNYNEINRLLKTRNDLDYRSLPANISQEVLKQLNQDWMSFFSLLNKKQNNKYDNPVRIPSYKEKQSQSILVLNVSTLSKICNSILIPKTKVRIEGLLHLKTATQIRIIPRGDHFVIEEIYDRKEKEKKIDNKRYASIDLGINNLAAVSSNVIKSFIINGRPIKSINRYYNRKKARLESELERINKQKTSNRLRRLALKRKNKIDWYMHNASKYIVNLLASNNINTLIVGINKGWKQETNIGRVNNQKFVCIPHSRFVSMLKYKCKLEGINFVEQEESYTSKVSFLDNDFIPIYGKSDDKFNPSGRRIKRGLYQSKNHQYLNADINGSFNIMRKYLNVVSNSIIGEGNRGLVVSPDVVTF